MKKILIFLGALGTFFSNVAALEFGGMGNVSAGMGGAGVALSSSPYGIYYNPALLSADNKTKFGYSIGVQYRQKNIDKLANVDFRNIASSPESLESFKDILTDNNLSIISQNGIVFQLSSSVIREEFGVVSLAYFGSAYANLSVATDPDRMDLIVQDGANYHKLITNGMGGYDSVPTTQADYQAHSLVYALQQGNVHKLVTSTFVLSEIPIAYAKTLYLENSNLNFGVALKLMNGVFSVDNIYLGNSFSQDNFKNPFSKGSYESSTNFGVDLGMMYEIDFPKFRYLTLGIVAKNVNSPIFKYSTENIMIKPQYRIGIAYNERYFTLALDADILPNDMLNFSYEKQQSQMIGGGVKFDLKYVDLRAGLMKDIRQDDGVILTGGINILGLFDISIQTGTKIGEAKGYKIPRYLDLKLGGSFSF
ncbi:conjugal transfer protein TraF [Helicobacter cappadocius]|uniref:Conjugal transfer protein TraF n=1 Tax=Helicobacter cappadocius TaxID=3063998 RepID=A0AA90T594_9HELI|nr:MULTISPECIES: conjugal transfer protein TraF [unclassified Helicobacter]MDO7253259.1 conjugal transfer protein TraF [Helicobacter sp. faydin-H75]MDP2539183.1 conjugal transfer protein TraF [Helicobacter sp. faydin-H76]